MALSSESDEVIAARKLLRDKLTELSTAMEFAGIVLHDAISDLNTSLGFGNGHENGFGDGQRNGQENGQNSNG